MTTAELLLQDYDMEMGMTRRTLERIPEDKPDYKPHEKSMPMGKLARHVATLPKFGTFILTTPSMDLTTAKWPEMIFSSREKLLADFDALAAEARAALAFRHMFFNHLIHHRAQLGVYLRLNDVPVPGVYGPSADEPFKP